MTFPDDCIQHLLLPWWEKKMPPKRERWRLVRVYVRHVTAAPYEVIPEGRTEAKEHGTVNWVVGNFRADERLPMTPLPVAGIPTYVGERLTLNRGKVRPALIVAMPGTTVEQAVRTGLPKGHFMPTYIVAPYYTAESTGSQGGFGSEFVRRTKLCEYTQCFWDMLPLSTGHPGSILRFDQLQAVEPEINSLRPTEWILSQEAQEVLHEMLLRHLSQSRIEPEGLAALAVEEIKARPDIP
jgi:hypothetical protein